MQRDRKNAVTGKKLSLLVPSTKAEMEGVATFEQEDGQPEFVRTFRSSDLAEAGRHLSKEEMKRFTAVTTLKGALRSASTFKLALEIATTIEFDDFEPTGLNSPLNGIYPGLSNRGQMSLSRSWKRQLQIEGKDAARKDPGWMLSYLLSGELRRARIVLWWNKRSFSPALWCPDMKTAYYARILLGPVSGKGFSICLHCGDWFVQGRPDQTYCQVSHREAHRVARWRAKQKLGNQK